METQTLETPIVKRSKYHPASSRKPQAIKTEVIARRAQGQTKSRIAKEIGIAHNTVNCIIEESGIEKQLESGQLQCARLITSAVDVVSQRLSKGSETAAFRLLEGIGVLGHNALKSRNGLPGDTGLVNAIQMLVQPGATVNVNAIESSTKDVPTDKT